MVVNVYSRQEINKCRCFQMKKYLKKLLNSFQLHNPSTNILPVHFNLRPKKLIQDDLVSTSSSSGK